MWIESTDETAYPLLLVVWQQSQVQIKVEPGMIMVKALRQWLEANELLKIVLGVIGALVLLSMLLVFGGYLLVSN